MRKNAALEKRHTEGHLKRTSLLLAAAIPVALTLTGCDKIKSMIGGKPKGQVVATVNGDEITTTELQAELGNFKSRDPAAVKAAQQQALQQIIMRDLITQKAKEAKLDKSPQYILQVRRGEESLLANLYERKLAASAAVPARQDAEAFVSSHPEMFAERKVFVVDQILASPAKLKREDVAPLKTLEEVKSYLTAQGSQFQETQATVDTLTVDPHMTQALEKLPAGEVFVTPRNGVVVFNRITQTKSLPLIGDPAINYAINVLRGQKAQDVVRTQILAMRQAADAAIVYNPAYKPAKPFSITPDAPAAGAAAPDATGAAAAPAATQPATK
jgi:EpsD family peptidyl-prolyl cis-trans isomerase